MNNKKIGIGLTVAACIVIAIVFVKYGIEDQTLLTSTETTAQATTTQGVAAVATSTVNTTPAVATATPPNLGGAGGGTISTSKSAPTQTKPAEKLVVVKPSPAQSSSVVIKGYAFTPGTITVKKGTTITWTNQDIAKHNIVSDTGAFESPFIVQGGTYSYTFTSAGTFNYHCSPHPYMTGTVIVTE